MNINSVVIGGNLTRDPQLKYLPNGTACLEIGSANNRKYKSGEDLKEETSFFGLTAFGRTAENISKYFKKGSPILVEGRLKTDQWEKEGKKFSKTKIIVEKFHFCGGKKSENEAGGESQSSWE